MNSPVTNQVRALETECVMNSSSRTLRTLNLPHFGLQGLHDAVRTAIAESDFAHMLRGYFQLLSYSGEYPGKLRSPLELSDNRDRIHGDRTLSKYGTENIPTLIIPSIGKLNVPTETAKPRWATQIALLRKKLGMNQQEFAAAISTAQGNVSKWENGDHKPTPDMLTRIATLAPDVDKFYFLEEAGIPSSFFMEGLGKALPKEMVKAAESVITRVMSPGGSERKIEIVMVPLLSQAVAASNPLTINEKDIEQVIPMLSSWLPRSGKIFAIYVPDDSMSPMLYEGNLVLIDVSKTNPKKLIDHMTATRVGDIVTIKWLRSDERFFMLVPQNLSMHHQVKVLGPGEDWNIVGEVVKWIGTPPSPPPPKRK